LAKMGEDPGLLSRSFWCPAVSGVLSRHSQRRRRKLKAKRGGGHKKEKIQNKK